MDAVATREGIARFKMDLAGFKVKIEGGMDRLDARVAARIERAGDLLVLAILGPATVVAVVEPPQAPGAGA